MSDCWPNGTDGVDYVECRLCKFAGNKITQHVRLVHGMTKQEYAVLHGSLCSQASSARYGASGNFDWIKRETAKGNDLKEYRLKMGKAVSEAIMSDPNERARRSKTAARTIALWAKTPEARQVSSDTAKKTSAREDVMIARTKRMHTARKPSKAERVLETILFPLGFKRSQVVHDASFPTKTRRKVVDFMNSNSRVIVEFDGGQHFKQAWKNSDLHVIAAGDAALNAWVSANQFCIVRISYDTFSYKRHAFDEDVLCSVIELVTHPTPGVHLIGRAYDEHRQS